MSKIKTEKNRDNRRDIELPPNAKTDTPLEVEEQTGAEKLLMASQPYWSHIALGVLVCILAWVIISYLAQNSREAAAEPSRQLADAMQQFNVTSNVDSLKQMKEDYPNEVATNWAMLVAGDYELNRGLSQIASDREGAMRLIKRAKESFQSVVDSPSTAKTTMQQRRSMFSLAYAQESLGEFDAAKAMYQRVLDEAPDSIFVDSAQRGVERASNPEFQQIYQDFASYKPAMDEAPGVAVPEAPVIDFPAIDLPKEEPAADTSSTQKDVSDETKMTEKVTQPSTEADKTTSEGSTTSSAEEDSTTSTEIKDSFETAADDIEDSASATIEKAADNTNAAIDSVKEGASEAAEDVKKVVTEAVSE